ncbi:MAG: hypothetical protein NTW21_36005 [Verrucomicrobia bacterium]|nr:hypothetical protein [Verrucomicrobiota bacterium]
MTTPRLFAIRHLGCRAGLSLLAAASSAAAVPALTIYNQNFAVVRDTVPLDLKAGVNEARFSGMTAQAETDSVILRDPAGKVKFQILEQAYRNDPVSSGLMLQLNEGKTIDFFIREPNKPDRTVQGKIIRSGYNPGGRPATQPIIEVDKKLQFSLPGEPIFPSLGDDTILNPTLSWTINAAEPAKFDAELAYVTAGLTWQADYNIVAADKGDTIDIVGWVTFKNESGTTFKQAKVKLMAGDVNKVQPQQPRLEARMMKAAMADGMAAPVSEKAFDEFHLYTIARPVTLRNQETKQVEFVRGSGVKAPKIYVYDGATMNYGMWNYFRGEGEYGIQTNKKVWTLREFKNSKENNLGMALPKGRLRFYLRDDDGSLQFTGENNIDHTPKDETVRVYLGNSFDLVGERRRVAYKVDSSNHWLDETFEMKLRNHKKDAVEIRVVEHLSRWDNWELKEKSTEFRSLDSHTIEFPVTVKPDEEKIVTYLVHYTW